MKNRNVINYPGSQKDMYSMVRSGWNNCMMLLPEFQAYKAMYTEAYITQKLQEIDAAENVPNDVVRFASRAIMRRELSDQNTACCVLFQQLSGYIRSAFPASQVKKLLQMAGKKEYKNAWYKSWGVTVIMNGMMRKFIAEHEEELMMNDNMPATFLSQVEAAEAAFAPLHIAYLDAGQTIYTSEKIKVNNKVFDDCRKMFADARIIFRADPAKRKLFTMTALRFIVSGARRTENE